MSELGSGKEPTDVNAVGPQGNPRYWLVGGTEPQYGELGHGGFAAVTRENPDTKGGLSQDGKGQGMTKDNLAF